MAKEKVLNIRLNQETLDQLDALVTLEGADSRSSYLRDLIEERYTMSQFIAADTMAQTLNHVAREEAKRAID